MTQKAKSLMIGMVMKTPTIPRIAITREAINPKRIGVPASLKLLVGECLEGVEQCFAPVHLRLIRLAE
jgi:hypothetical protein